VDCGNENLTYRSWSQPATADKEIRLPPITGASGFPAGPRRGCIEAVGRWANVDVWIQAPLSWIDVDFQLLAHSGDVEAVIEHHSLRTMTGAARRGNTVGGVLFSVRGRVADRYSVQAFNTTVDHAQAKFRMECWGDQGSMAGDRSTRQLVDVSARENQLQRFTSPVGGFPSAFAVPLFAANPSGGRTAVTKLEWTIDLFPPPGVVPSLLLERQPGPITVGRWFLGPDGRLLLDWQPPLYTQPGETFSLTRNVSGGNNQINVSGFYD
jgi:hypothetical protein